MAAFPGHIEPIVQVLTEALDKMGDLSGATVTLIDDAGEFTGNEKAAQLLEVFNTPARGNTPRNVTIVTRHLGQDSEQGFRITGVPPGFAGSEQMPGILKERFAQVNQKPFNNKMFPAIAELMVEEAPLPDTLREGMRAIVMDHMGKGGFRADSGLGNLRDFVNGYLKRDMTPEWEKRLVSNSPVTQVVNTMQQGLQGSVAAPATARFTRSRTP
ncbi:MAG: hypothetical protein IT560_06450 [Alphaproteobacteria bacterium]|nr:hypothetical protein [Alphaproteobacteria bacterium]